MNRRKFVGLAVGLVVQSYGVSQVPQADAEASLRIGAVRPQAAIPEEFVGLSYESAQLATPAFFSAKNRKLIELVRELAPRGNLRIGGGSSEYTTYSDKAPVGPPPFEVFGPDTSKTVKQGTVTTALALKNLRSFLDAVNWSCLYGLNLGQGTVENAVREAAAAHRILGPKLLALQIGNEPDSFRRRFRPESYDPAEFIAEWNRFHDAIAKAVPGARFAGPDISNKLPYLTAFAAEAPRHKDVVLLTSHYYAMGPAGNPAATLENLLEPDPKLSTLKARDLHVIAEARESAVLPYRMSEGNSCWDGGKAGVSNTFASALWCADYMMACMGRGWAGVNLHGGGNGFYTPIAGAPSTGFKRRPEYFGMRFAQRFVGTRCVEVELTGADAKVDAFVFERSRTRELAVVNKSTAGVTIALPPGMSAMRQVMLRAPAIDALEDVELTSVEGNEERAVRVPAYTAITYMLSDSGSNAAAKER